MPTRPSKENSQNSEMPASFASAARASLSVIGLNLDEAPPGVKPRQRSINAIDSAIAGIDGETVGHGVRNSIGAIRTLAGERGARSVHEVFEDKSLVSLYRIPADSIEADSANREIAKRELAYWAAENANRPSPGTRIAVGVDPATRVLLQKAMGNIGSMARDFQDLGRRWGDQFGGEYFDFDRSETLAKAAYSKTSGAVNGSSSQQSSTGSAQPASNLSSPQKGKGARGL